MAHLAEPLLVGRAGHLGDRVRRRPARGADRAGAAAYDAPVAAYRQTVLTAFQEVEDSLAALRVLEQEARVQQEALAAARQTVDVVINQYKAGTVSYLNVIVAQTTALSSEQAAINILGRRMAASVSLVKALGGGWEGVERAVTFPMGPPP